MTDYRTQDPEAMNKRPIDERVYCAICGGNNVLRTIAAEANLPEAIASRSIARLRDEGLIYRDEERRWRVREEPAR